MKKIIIPFDGVHFSQGALDFAISLNESERILLSGIFLPQMDYANLWAFRGGAMAGPVFIPFMEDADEELIEKNIDRFKSLCEDNGVEHRIHKCLHESPISELKNESRFADLMIIGSEAFYENMGTDDLNAYFKDTLTQAECPVVIVPE